jgi:hypothetical protein
LNADNNGFTIVPKFLDTYSWQFSVPVYVSATELAIQAPGDIFQALGVKIQISGCHSIHIKWVAMLIKTVHSLYYTVLNFNIQILFYLCIEW